MTGIKKWIVETFPKVFPKNTYKYYRFLYGKTTQVYPIIDEFTNQYKFWTKPHFYTYFEDTNRPNYIGSYYVAWVKENGDISRLDGPAVIYNDYGADFVVNNKLVTGYVLVFLKQHDINLKDITEDQKMMLKLFMTQFL